MKSLIVIPARLASTRFPGKPMVEIFGVSMLERVWRIASASSQADAALIATDDKSIVEHARSFGAEVVLTSLDCKTGTDRVAEVAKLHSTEFDVFFSLQGDAVLTPPWVIDSLLQLMKDEPEVDIATPAVLLEGLAKDHFIAEKQKGSSSGTSVVCNKRGYALYFSKALLPFSHSPESVEVRRHIGLYCYRKEALLRMAELPQGVLEQSERLEQLRALEHGLPIRVLDVDYQGRTHGSVDRPEDVAVVEAIIAMEGELTN